MKPEGIISNRIYIENRENIMNKPFEIDITCHDCYGIQFTNSVDDFMKKVDFLKFAVLANHIESPFYKAKQKVNPFIQSLSDNFIMIEFWTYDFDAVESYVEFLNEQYKKW
jgi:hypothetical protein